MLSIFINMVWGAEKNFDGDNIVKTFGSFGYSISERVSFYLNKLENDEWM